ncbi:substrate-binding domain-containing protein [Chloroflexota bacterium]
MKQILLTTLLALAITITLIGGLAACDSDDETTAEPDTPATTSETTGEELTPDESGRLKVATTTSLDNTGLWETLEPMFEEANNVDLDIVAVGTGIALEYGRNGDADVITVHSKAREIEYVEQGHGMERVPFAYNYFLIVGPEDDPAGIKGMSPEDVFKTLFESETGTFVSRGDDSGTHGKEKTIWANAGYDYEDVRTAGSWYLEAGSGMGATLVIADEKRGYTLSDTGTYLSYKGDLDLVPIVDEGATLLNVYSVIVGTDTEMSQKAQALVDFLTSDEVQEIMGDFGFDEYGMALFTPCAGPIAPCDS